MATSDFSTGKTIFVLAIVVGCFAILWPRVFHPMMQTAFSMTKPQISNEKSANARPAAGCCDVVYDYDINNNFFARLCEMVVHREEMEGTKGLKPPKTVSLLPKERTPGVTQMCRDKVLELCHVDIEAVLTEDPKKPRYAEVLEDLRNQNVSYCLRRHYEKHEKFIELTQKMRHRRFLTARKQQQQQRRPEHSPLLHPAMRERGVPIATRIREPFAHKPKVQSESLMGGRPGAPSGHTRMPPPTVKGGGSGSMGFIMPLYTVGIVVFFIYTVMKYWKQIRARALVLFKRSEDSQQPSFKGYPVDPEYRKFVLSQKYGEPVPSYQEFLRQKEERSVGKRVLEEDDQKLMFTAIEGIIAEMDEYRERISAPETATAGDKAEASAVDITDLPAEGPTARQFEENGSATIIAHTGDLGGGTVPTVVVGEPKIAPVQVLRDSLQAQMSLEDSDLLPTIPEDAKFAVVGVETTAVFEGRSGTPTPFARSPTPTRLFGRGTSPGRALTPTPVDDRASTPATPTPTPTPEPTSERQQAEVPAEVTNIILETNIPSEAQLLVAEPQTETISVAKADGSDASTIEGKGETQEMDDEEEEEEQPVIIAGKMTISLIDMQANHVESTSPTSSAPTSPGGTSNLQGDDSFFNFSSIDTTNFTSEDSGLPGQITEYQKLEPVGIDSSSEVPAIMDITQSPITAIKDIIQENAILLQTTTGCQECEELLQTPAAASEDTTVEETVFVEEMFIETTTVTETPIEEYKLAIQGRETVGEEQELEEGARIELKQAVPQEERRKPEETKSEIKESNFEDTDRKTLIKETKPEDEVMMSEIKEIKKIKPQNKDKELKEKDKKPEDKGKTPEVKGTKPEDEGKTPKLKDSKPEDEGVTPEVKDTKPKVKDTEPEVKDTQHEEKHSKSERKDPKHKIEETKSEAKDTRPEVKDSKPEIKDTTPEAKDTMPKRKDSKAEIKDTKPEGKDIKPEIKETESEAKDAKPETKVTKPEAKDSKPEIKDTKPEAKDMKPEGKGTKSEAKDAKPQTKDTKPEAKDTKPEIKETKSKVEGMKPHDELKKPDAKDDQPAGEKKNVATTERKPEEGMKPTKADEDDEEEEDDEEDEETETETETEGSSDEGVTSPNQKPKDPLSHVQVWSYW